MNDRTSAVTDVVVIPADPAHVQSGIMAWASCSYFGLRIDHLTVRRPDADVDGRLFVTFPAKPMIGGQRRYYVWPIESGLRDRIEAAVLREYLRLSARASRLDGDE